MFYLASKYPWSAGLPENRVCMHYTNEYYQFAANYDELITKSWPAQRWDVKYYSLSDLRHSINISNDIDTKKLVVPFLTFILRHLRKFEQNLLCSIGAMDVLVTCCYAILGKKKQQMFEDC